MSMHQIATALQRVEAILMRRPEAGLHDDASATARWAGGTRVVAHHANGTEMVSDMPAELGGTGDRITPGWMFRAGLASCATTSIAMAAVADGVALDTLEVRASSRSDTRGFLGMVDADGGPVPAGPRDLQLHVRISSASADPDRLRALVEAALRRSPVPSALNQPTPLAVQIEVGAA